MRRTLRAKHQTLVAPVTRLARLNSTARISPCLRRCEIRTCEVVSRTGRNRSRILVEGGRKIPRMTNAAVDRWERGRILKHCPCPSYEDEGIALWDRGKEGRRMYAC
jgi:hypothetical protein